ncbi:hypothetical protein [Natronoglycomyces albus]|uniref:Uncharacterized protein n=1 Tax=Natronoglycomyces albus TaxID=2811108 RepID=A0A895XY13_9ACTN|nr:hypothetical protein [Natronoglycomyces albus]QSB06508.1 hypothetical protein JQS30_06285 [Natronoglycomyces albus]
MTGETLILTDPSSSERPVAKSRYGSLDMPLTVWHIADSSDLMTGLLAQLQPCGPVAAIDVDGWEAAAAHGREVFVYSRNEAADRHLMASASVVVHDRVRIASAGATEFIKNVNAQRQKAGLVVASGWVLRAHGVLSAVVDQLRPGGYLVIIAHDDREAVDVAMLVTDAQGGATGLAFTAHLIAVTRGALDAARAEHHTLAGADRPKRARRHLGVAIWTVAASAGGDGDV